MADEHFEEDRDPPLGIQLNGESRHAGQHRNWALDVFLRWLVDIHIHIRPGDTQIPQ